MTTTPRMNAAMTSNERYRVGCELEAELAAIIPRLNAEWQAKLDKAEAKLTVAVDALNRACITTGCQCSAARAKREIDAIER